MKRQIQPREMCLCCRHMVDFGEPISGRCPLFKDLARRMLLGNKRFYCEPCSNGDCERVPHMKSQYERTELLLRRAESVLVRVEGLVEHLVSN